MADEIPPQHDPPPSLPPTARGPNAAELTPPAQGRKPPSSRLGFPSGGVEGAQGTGGLGFKFTPSVPEQDLSSDKLLAKLSRTVCVENTSFELGYS